MSQQDDLQRTFSRCFRCTAGCLHLICGNVTLTLTAAEFLVLSEAIAAMRHQLEKKRNPRESYGKSKRTLSLCKSTSFSNTSPMLQLAAAVECSFAQLFFSLNRDFEFSKNTDGLPVL
jgi:hypothetical protein